MTPQRFIPAHAGNTCVLRGVLNPFSVHPRARGEHHGVRENLYRDAGSSPRTRGTPLQLDHNDFQTRFIPAHAGNTDPRRGGDRRMPVHPRARGEHACTSGARVPPTGSSPRTRGTQLRVRRGRLQHRFIPAHAGNTWPHEQHQRSPAVHPRARGEHTSRPRTASRKTGSSPRTRGTRGPARRDRRPRRFIPAHAGNTLPIISLCYKDLEERELSTELPEGKDPFSGVVKEPLV